MKQSIDKRSQRFIFSSMDVWWVVPVDRGIGDCPVEESCEGMLHSIKVHVSVRRRRLAGCRRLFLCIGVVEDSHSC